MGVRLECDWSVVPGVCPGAWSGPGPAGGSNPGLALRRPGPSYPVRESKVTVKIPRPLYRKIQAVVDGSGFNSPTDFIVYVLRDLMGEAEEHPREFTQDELDEVKRKLKNLGYL